MYVTQCEQVKIFKSGSSHLLIEEVTESDFILINSMYSHFKKELGKQLDILTSAFVNKHNLFSKKMNNTGGKNKDIDMDAVIDLMAAMKSEGYTKRIGDE